MTDGTTGDAARRAVPAQPDADDAYRPPPPGADNLWERRSSPPRPISRPPVPADVEQVYGRSAAAPSSSFDLRSRPHPPAAPPPVPALPPAARAAFGRPAGVEGSFPAGAAAPPRQPEPESPWWSPNADLDPWRDPDSEAHLGGPPVFGSDQPEPPSADVDEEVLDTDSAGTRARKRWHVSRPGIGGLAVIVVCCLTLAAGGGAMGFWLAAKASDSPLFDRHATLTAVDPAVQRSPGSVADIARRVLPAVVSIEVRAADEQGTGSGVVISKDGYVLTNNHVVSLAAGAKGTVRTNFNDQVSLPARIVGRDPASDLAVIKVDRSDLTVARLGQSSKVIVGDDVIAIGSPFGLAGTVTSGIVSSLDRPVHLSGEGSDTDAVIDAIQTDAAINPGNSGGALVNSAGAVIGINSAIASGGSSGTAGNVGVGFAIPIDSAREVAQSLIRGEKVRHPTLGVNARSVTDTGRRGGTGAEVVAVSPGGPGEQAGIKESDVITTVAGKPVLSSDSLAVLIAQHKVGETVEIGIERGGGKRTVKATLTEG